MKENKTSAEAKGGLRDELALPEGVAASVKDRTLAVKGPKGESSRDVKERNVTVSVEGNNVVISSAKSSKREKKISSSLKAHVTNMIRGVTEGHVYRMKVCFTHFPITVIVSGSQVVVKNFLGEKTPRNVELPKGVNAKVEGSEVVIEGVNKEKAGQAAAAIEQLTKRSNFDTRVFGDGIYITVKDGKDIK